MSANTLEITKANFKKTIQDHEIVLLDFWASWCGPCRKFGPIFENVAAKHPEIAFGKVNSENELELAETFSISSIPTVMAFRSGVLVFSQPGLLSESMLEKLIQEIKGLDMEKIKNEINAQNLKKASGA